jgi:integrase
MNSRIQRCQEAPDDEKVRAFTIPEFLLLREQLQKHPTYDALVCYLYGFSARIQDAFGLKRSSFIEQHEKSLKASYISLKLVTIKGKRNIRYVSEKDCALVVYEYAKKSDAEFLFGNHHEKDKIKARYLRLVDKLNLTDDLKAVCKQLHSYRRSGAQHLDDENVGEQVVMNKLQHKNIATTQIYLKKTDNQINKTFETIY